MKTKRMVLGTCVVSVLLVVAMLSAACSTSPGSSYPIQSSEAGPPMFVLESQPGPVPLGERSEGTRSHLTLSRDDGHIEAEIELHTARVGERWRVRFASEGVRFFTVLGTTVPEDGGEGSPSAGCCRITLEGIRSRYER